MNSDTIKIGLFDSKALDPLKPLLVEFKNAQQNLVFRDDWWIAFEQWLQALRNDANAVVCVARVADEAAGLLIGRIESNGPLVSPGQIGYISLVAVAKDCQRRGIGTLLWQWAQKWFADREVKEIQLYTDLSNASACAFWKNIGFSAYVERRRIRI